MRKRAAYILLIILGISLLILACGCKGADNTVNIRYYMDDVLYRTQNVETPERFNLIESPEKQEGRVFNGWYYVINGRKMNGSIDKECVNNGVLEVEAKWLYKDIKINYNFEGANYNPKVCNVDSEFELRPVEKHGYTFDCWRDNNGGYVRRIYKPTYGVDIVIYPQFTLNTYKIEYNLHGGSMPYKAEEYTVEDKNFLPDSPTKDGYYFLGWSEKGDYNLIEEINTSKGKDITLYAMWQKGTAGLVFEEGATNTYAVTGYIGSDTDIIIPDNYMGRPVKSVKKNAFKDRRITSVDIGENVEVIGQDAFSGCEVLAKVNLRNGLTEIKSYAFRNCAALTKIEFPSSLLSIGLNAFEYTGLTEAKFSEDSMLQRIEGSVFASTKLKSFFLPKNVNMLGDLAFSYCSLDEFIFHPEYNAEQFNLNAFRNMKLKKLSLPSTIVSIGGFLHLEIEELDLSACASLKSIDKETFSNSKLKHIILPPNLETIGVQSFCYSSLTSVVVPRSVRVIDSLAFAYSAISQIEFEGGSRLTHIQNDAFKDTELTSVQLPSSLIVLGNDVFNGCENLRSVTFEANSKLEIIGDLCFGNTPITHFEMPNSVKYIGSIIFGGCDELTSVHLAILGMSHDSTLTNLSYLGITESIKKVFIGGNVTRINSNAFEGYSNLQVYIPRSVEVIEENAFLINQVEVFAEAAEPPVGWYSEISQHAAIHYNSSKEDMENV